MLSMLSALSAASSNSCVKHRLPVCSASLPFAVASSCRCAFAPPSRLALLCWTTLLFSTSWVPSLSLRPYLKLPLPDLAPAIRALLLVSSSWARRRPPGVHTRNPLRRSRASPPPVRRGYGCTLLAYSRCWGLCRRRAPCAPNSPGSSPTWRCVRRGRSVWGWAREAPTQCRPRRSKQSEEYAILRPVLHDCWRRMPPRWRLCSAGRPSSLRVRRRSSSALRAAAPTELAEQCDHQEDRGERPCCCPAAVRGGQTVARLHRAGGSRRDNRGMLRWLGAPPQRAEPPVSAAAALNTRCCAALEPTTSNDATLSTRCTPNHARTARNAHTPRTRHLAP